MNSSIVLLVATTILTLSQSGELLPDKPDSARLQLPAEVQIVPAEITSRDTVPFLNGPPGMIVASACLENGTMFLRMRSDPTKTFSVSASAKGVATFSADKAVDISNPTGGTFFADERSAYMLIRGAEDLRTVKMKGRRPNGEIQQFSGQRPLRVYKFIARFDHDGTYRGSVKLDLPFQVIHFAAFPDGGYVVSGLDQDRNEPRVALLKWNGQFERYLELEGDIFPGDTESGEKLPGKNPLGFGRVDWAVSTSQLLPYDGKILLRRGQEARVFVISPSGEVRWLDLKLPSGFLVQSITRSNGRLIGVLSRRRGDGIGLEFAIYSFDPQTGEAIERYVFPEPVGVGLACANTELTFLRQDHLGNVVVWRTKEKKALHPAPTGEVAINPN